MATFMNTLIWTRSSGWIERWLAEPEVAGSNLAEFTKVNTPLFSGVFTLVTP